jgi:hypothetical protein
MAVVSPGSTTVTIAGQVTNTTSPGGLTVQLGGKVNGTAATDANGNYSATLQASGLGVITAATTDGQSNVAQFTLVDTEAVITAFTDMHGSQSLYTFTGHVAGGYEGEVVNFGGLHDLQGQSATVDANGNFSITVQLDGLADDNGFATAQTVDAWGITSNLALDFVAQDITYRG